MRKQILATLFSFMLVSSLLLLPTMPVSAATSKLNYLEFDGGTTTSLNSINSDGTGDSVLASTNGFANGQSGMEWSPDGTKFAYVRTPSGGGTYEIHVMNADGSGDTAITSDNTSGAFGISWSPDSTKIVFGSIEAGPAYIIYSINADGTGRTQLTNSGIDVCPKWASSNKIAFVSFRDGNTELYAMNADGTSQTNISNDGSGSAIDGLVGTDCALSVSPDGTKIVYTTDRDALSSIYELYSVNFDGTSNTRLTTSVAAAINFFPIWSNNGTKIAYSSNNHDVAGGGNAHQIYSMNADGSSQTQLTSLGGNVIIAGSQFGGISWSPDDSQIAFSSNRNGTPQLFLMNANGSNQTMLVADYSFSPRWQPSIAAAATPGATPATSSSLGTLASTGIDTRFVLLSAIALFGGGALALVILVRRKHQLSR